MDNDVIEHLIALVDAMTNQPSRFTSLYHFKKIINIHSFPFHFHHLCPHCNSYIGLEHLIVDDNGDIVDKESTILCVKCNKNISLQENRQSNGFLYLPLSQHFQVLCERRHQDFLNPSNRQERCSFAIEDIMDGRLYKDQMSQTNMNDTLSLNFSIDGTPLFKSSQTSITPILCTINELDPRYRKTEVIVASIFLGNKKPPMNEYLKPFVAEAEKLATEGVSYKVDGTRYNKKFRVLVGVCDSVERPKLRCSTSFRGSYGCGLCKRPGQEVSKDNGHVRVFPIDNSGNAFEEGLRTHSETKIHVTTKEKGIKNRSEVFNIPGFNIMDNLTVDWMHCVALGVCQQFLKLWFDSVYHEREFYLGNVVDDIDTFLQTIRPSLDISRTPRKISDRLHFKTHELVIWLLFYSLPSLQPYLPRKFLEHWSLLIESIAILLQVSILETDVYYAQRCIFKFVKDIELLYGLEHISFNVHLLCHLPQIVLNWRPLWTHSALCYKNFHQLLKKLVKSSNSASIQIYEAIKSQIALHSLIKSCDEDLNLRQRKLLEKLTQKKSTVNKVTVAFGNVKLIGKNEEKSELSSGHYLAEYFALH